MGFNWKIIARKRNFHKRSEASSCIIKEKLSNGWIERAIWKKRSVSHRKKNHKNPDEASCLWKISLLGRPLHIVARTHSSRLFFLVSLVNLITFFRVERCTFCRTTSTANFSNFQSPFLVDFYRRFFASLNGDVTAGRRTFPFRKKCHTKRLLIIQLIATKAPIVSLHRRQPSEIRRVMWRYAPISTAHFASGNEIFFFTI